MRDTHLKLGIRPVDPLGIFRHPPSVAPVLDSHFENSRRVKDARAVEAAVELVSDRVRGGVLGCVGKDRSVPAGKIGVIGDELREGLPLVRRRN